MAAPLMLLQFGPVLGCEKALDTPMTPMRIWIVHLPMVIA